LNNEANHFKDLNSSETSVGGGSVNGDQKRRQSSLVRFHNKEKMTSDILGKQNLQFWDEVRLHYQTERLKALEKEIRTAYEFKKNKYSLGAKEYEKMKTILEDAHKEMVEQHGRGDWKVINDTYWKAKKKK